MYKYYLYIITINIFVKMVKTRSQIKKENENNNNKEKKLFEVNIDFDESSRMWRENKWDLGGGTYRYRCLKEGRNGSKCISKCLPGEQYCKTHIKFKNK